MVVLKRDDKKTKLIIHNGSILFGNDHTIK